MNTKVADNNLLGIPSGTPWPVVGAGAAAAGAGTFALAQLVHEVLRQRDAKKHENLPSNALVVDYPVEAQKQASEGIPDHIYKSALEAVNNAFAMLAGAPAGYYATKGIYDYVKGKQLKKEVGEANERYLKTLQGESHAKASQKQASATPHVDAFCTAVAEAIDKQASMADKARYIWPALLGAGATGLTVKDFANNDNSRNIFSEVGHDTHSVLKALAGAVALGGAASMIQASRKKGRQQEATRANEELPTAVALNYPQVAGTPGVSANGIDPTITTPED